ncbi:hypothetical protein HPB50_013732 [Hyalomma asiaticum]|uniref:Uncharacterized protein n=1 Tax=Hyalomma asiaticum TaxID=266040 RepID=A0ACB7S1B4_HYAAI|nr:hypothetical protein HPB50_013732 [Hyalomma asiaticum]
MLTQVLERAQLNISTTPIVESEDTGRPTLQETNASYAIRRLSLAAVSLNPQDILRSAKKLCGLLEQGVLAVLGSLQPETTSLVRTACFRHRIPHFYSHRDDDAPSRVAPDSVSITLSPSPVELSRALQDLVQAQRWSHFTIVYERPEALVRLRGLLSLSSASGGKRVPVSLRKLTAKEDPRPLLREIAKSGDSNVVLDLDAERLADVLAADMHTLDLSHIQNSGTNLTGFELLNREQWEQDIGAVREAYVHKGVYPIFLGQRPLRNPVRTHFSGLTGPIWLDPLGRRRNVSLHVVKLKRRGLTAVGTWSASSGLHLLRAEKSFQEEVLSTLRNKTLRITTILNAPYMMLKASAHKLRANDRFEGSAWTCSVKSLDILDSVTRSGLSGMVHMVRETPKGAGMEADLAVGDITITSAREDAVDFTLPFMTLE